MSGEVTITRAISDYTILQARRLKLAREAEAARLRIIADMEEFEYKCRMLEMATSQLVTLSRRFPAAVIAVEGGRVC